MNATTDRPKLKTGWDPAITGLKALKEGAVYAATLFLSDQSGITAYVVSQLPPEYSQYGAVVPIAVGIAIRAVLNWLKHR